MELGPQFHMTKKETFLEVMHHINDSRFHQQVDGKLAVRVLGLIQVHVEISQQDGVKTPEARQGLL